MTARGSAAALRAVPTVAPAPPDSTDALFQRAVDEHRKQRLDEAARLYGLVIARDRSHAPALHHLGALLTQRGRLAEAASLIERALEAIPDSAEAHNNLGIVLHQMRRHEAALEHYRKALALAPDFAEAHNNLANALHALARHEEAIGHYRRSIELKPGYAEALANLGGALRALNRFEEATDAYRQALAIRPHYAKAHKCLGNVLQARGMLAEAVEHYEKALALTPAFPEAHNDLGNALQALERHALAIEHYEKALALRPSYAHAHYNLGNAFQALNRHEEAIACYKRAIELQPSYAKAHNNMGTALNALGRPAEAIVHFQRALQLQPDFAGAHNNFGNALQLLNRYGEAIAEYQAALAIDPAYAEAMSNLGHALHALNRHREAIIHYRKARAVKPGHADAHWNEALAQLALGNYESGWPGYEWRWLNRSLGLAHRQFAAPLWLGKESLAGKTILLHAEQGLGDTLQFARYIPLVTGLGARVVLEVQPPLAPLFASYPGLAEVKARGEAPPAYDFHCPLMSLPFAFGTRLETIPPAVLSFASAADRRERWRPLVERLGRPRVGIAWAGNPAHKNDRNRSIPLDHIMPLLQRLAPSAVVLQKQMPQAESRALAAIPDLFVPGERLADFADTAAIVAMLDVVITVDTSVAHLAGALGKPVWILLPFSADWRWLIGRSDSPWYPSARLFRQPAIGDWNSVIAEVAEAVASFPPG